MMQLVHGGDWAGYRAQYGQDALDFSANVSPLGLPEGVAKAITAALATADRYPDPLCRALRAKLAVHEKMPMEHILCGNGAADLIFRLVWAAKPRTALLPAPTFAEYAAALETAGCTVRRHFLRESEDFAVTEAFISAVDEHTDMVFLCQPNNPTGQPWAVSSLAQAAGLAALDETAYVARVQELIAEQRPILRDGLRALGLRVLDGSANYLLFQAPETLGDALRQRGIVLRSCGNYPGLDGSWYRTAVRTAPENQQLLKTLQEVLA